MYITFIANTNAKKEIFLGAHEPSKNITIPLLLLALGSIFVGYLAKEAVLSNVIPPIISNTIKIIPLLFSLFGAIFAFSLYNSTIVGRIWGPYPAQDKNQN